MPSTYAHYVFGKEVFQKYPKSLQERISPHLPLYHIGLHGPDILFYYKPLSKNPVNQTGHLMHDQPASLFFEKAAGLLRETEEDGLSDKRMAYLCGFLCHFALDSCCHSYVKKKIQVSGITHTEIEVEFDRCLLVRDGKDPIRQHLTEHIIPAPEYAQVIEPFFPVVTAKEVEKSLRSMIKCDRLFVAPNPVKRQLIYTLLGVSKSTKGLRGLLVNPEPNPECRDSNDGLRQRMEEAAPLCLRLTDNFQKVVGNGIEFDRWFEKTFSFGDGWQNIVI